MAHIAEKVRLRSERGHRVTSLGRLQEGRIRARFPHWDADSPGAVSAHDRLVPLAIKSELDLVAVVSASRATNSPTRSPRPSHFPIVPEMSRSNHVAYVYPGRIPRLPKANV